MHGERAAEYKPLRRVGIRVHLRHGEQEVMSLGPRVSSSLTMGLDLSVGNHFYTNTWSFALDEGSDF